MKESKLVPKSKPRFSTVEALAWLAFALLAFIATFGFDGPLPTFKLGAAFWPRLVLAGIVVVALILLVTSLVRRTDDVSQVVDERLTDALPEDAAHVTKKTVAIFVLPLVYAYAQHKLGFLLVTPVFFLVYMYLLGVRRWRTLFAVTASLYAAIVLVFVKLIFTPLPQGAGVFYTLNGHFIGLIQ